MGEAAEIVLLKKHAAILEHETWKDAGSGAGRRDATEARVVGICGWSRFVLGKGRRRQQKKEEEQSHMGTIAAAWCQLR